MRHPPAAVLRGTAAVPVVLAALELVHPTWSGSAIADGVAAAGGTWLALHTGLLVGYVVLTWRLWQDATPARPGRVMLGGTLRLALAAFAVLNTMFFLIDGIAVGLLAASDPLRADALWSAPAVSLLANATGAAWSAALLLLAATWSIPTASTDGLLRGVSPGLALTWLAFLASTPAIGLAPIASRVAAIATATLLVYARGAEALPAGLLIVSAVLRQHVGPEAALGLLLIAIALTAKSLTKR